MLKRAFLRRVFGGAAAAACAFGTLPSAFAQDAYPGKPIRKRFDENQIAMLLEMEWWDWPEEQLKAAMPLLCSGDIAALHAFWQG